MNNLTRILIVEDHTPDFELAQREIRKVLEHCKFQRVKNRRDYLKALKSFQPDFILSDDQLPGFDGMKALKLAREHAPLAPVILWTSSVSEDTAVDCMKAGASDYLIKDNLKRLGPAVLRALQERQLRVERMKSEETRQAILDNSPVGIFQSTPEGRYISVNPAMARIYGYPSPAEMIRSVSDIASQIYAHPEERGDFTELFERQDVVENYERKNIRKDGTIFWTSTSARAVRDASGQISYYEGFLQDITERKESEEKLRASEANYRLLFENNPLPMWIYDLETLAFLKINEAAVQHYGYSMDEFLAMNIRDLQPPEDLPALLDNTMKVPGVTDKAGVRRHCRKDGSIIQVELVSHPIEFGGKRAELAHSIDITRRLEIELTEREQRTLAEALRHTAEALSSTLDYGQVLEQILTTVESVVPSDAATIMLIDEQRAHVVRTRGYKERGTDTEVMEVAFPLSETANLWQMFETGKPVIVSDTKAYPSWKKHPPQTGFVLMLARRSASMEK